MKKWFMIGIPVVIICAIAWFVYAEINGNPYVKYQMDKELPTHLEKAGESKAATSMYLFANPKFLINNDYYGDIYTLEFKDEPHMHYYYGLSKKDKKITQFCEKDFYKDSAIDTITKETKHAEKSCVSMYANRD